MSHNRQLSLSNNSPKSSGINPQTFWFKQLDPMDQRIQLAATAIPYHFIYWGKAEKFKQFCSRAKNQINSEYLSVLYHFKLAILKQYDINLLLPKLKKVMDYIPPNHVELIAAAYNLQGLIEQELGDHDAAFVSYSQGLLHEKSLQPLAAASLLSNLAKVLLRKNNNGGAYLRQSQAVEYLPEVSLEYPEHRNMMAIIYQEMAVAANRMYAGSRSEWKKYLQQFYLYTDKAREIDPCLDRNLKWRRLLRAHPDVVHVLASDIDNCLLGFNPEDHAHLSENALLQMREHRYDDIYLITHRALCTTMVNTVGKFCGVDHPKYNTNQLIFTHNIIEKLESQGFPISGVSTPDDRTDGFGKAFAKMHRFEKYLLEQSQEELEQLRVKLKSLQSDSMNMSFQDLLRQRLNLQCAPVGMDNEDIRAGLSDEKYHFDAGTKNPQLKQLIAHLNEKYPGKVIMITFMDDRLDLLLKTRDLEMGKTKTFIELVHCDHHEGFYSELEVMPGDDTNIILQMDGAAKVSLGKSMKM